MSSEAKGDEGCFNLNNEDPIHVERRCWFVSCAKQNLKIKADICPPPEKFSITSQATFVIWALD